MNLDNIIQHVRDRSYMSGIERDETRIKQTNEVFTPTLLVQEILDKFDQTLFSNPIKTFIDPTCGDGQALGEVLIRKLESGIEFEIALSTIYGVEFEVDNVELCRERLLCGRNDLRYIVEKNIVCADALRYHYRFDGSHPYDDEQKEQEFEDRLAKFVDFG